MTAATAALQRVESCDVHSRKHRRGELKVSTAGVCITDDLLLSVGLARPDLQLSDASRDTPSFAGGTSCG